MTLVVGIMTSRRSLSGILHRQLICTLALYAHPSIYTPSIGMLVILAVGYSSIEIFLCAFWTYDT